jgi:hypothetical protein
MKNCVPLTAWTPDPLPYKLSHPTSVSFAAPDFVDDMGMTPLCIACQFGNAKVSLTHLPTPSSLPVPIVPFPAQPDIL